MQRSFRNKVYLNQNIKCDSMCMKSTFFKKKSLPSANEVAERQCFYTCLSVILFTGGGVCLPSACWDTHPRAGQTSPGGQCSGRYASYWNAFLLFLKSSLFTRKTFTCTFCSLDVTTCHKEAQCEAVKDHLLKAPHAKTSSSRKI